MNHQDSAKCMQTFSCLDGYKATHTLPNSLFETRSASSFQARAWYTRPSHIAISKMGNSFRNQPFQTLYGEEKTPVTEDVLEVGLLVAFGIIGFCFILIIPGIRGAEVSKSVWLHACMVRCMHACLHPLTCGWCFYLALFIVLYRSESGPLYEFLQPYG